jgi:signal transduction histidine kinase
MTIPGLFGLKELLTKHRERSDLRAREERAQATQHEAMRAMQEALVAAHQAQQTRDEFLAKMSHELRTPLNAVIGFSRVLESNKAGNLRPEDIEMLSRVRASGQQLLRLVEDVLDQSHLSQGAIDVRLGDTNVVDIACKVVKNYRNAAAAKGISILAVVPVSAPTVHLDSGRFEQVLQHLVDNAVKFTGTGTVRVTLVTDAATHRPMRMIVSDTGIGIAAEQLDRIFEPFGQVDASRRRSYGGIGLGLPLARQLCEAMGCALTVDSHEGGGSRFTIRFPYLA